MQLKDICFTSSLSFCDKVGLISDVVSSDNLKPLWYNFGKTLPLVLILTMMMMMMMMTTLAPFKLIESLLVGKAKRTFSSVVKI